MENLVVSASSGNTTLLPVSGITLGGSGGNRTISLAPAAGQSGSSLVTISVTDGAGKTGTSSFTLNVTAPPVANGIEVSPANAVVSASGTQQFTAVLNDQFGQPVVPQPTFSWSVTGGGTINSSGLFTAGAAAGSFSVSAAASSFTGSANFSVTAGVGSGNVTLGSFFTINGGTLSSTGVDTVGTNMTASSSSAYDGALAQFNAPVTLAATGDKLTLTFVTESLATNNNQTWSFRYGLFNSNGNTVSANDQIAVSDLWTGYFAVRHTTSSAISNENTGGTADLTANSLFEQATGTARLIAESVGGGFGAFPAADGVTQLFARSDGNDAVGGADGTDGDFRSPDLPLTVTLVLERVANGLQITTTPRFSYGASGSFTFTDTSPTTYTFNAIAFGSIGNFRVDNVAVSSVVAPPPNTAPTVSAIADQTIDADTATSALAITIGDAETAAASLTLTGSSSNTTLLPDTNIVFGGSGASRTVTVTPAFNQTGTATITMIVSDGDLTASATFILTVTPNFSSWISTYPGVGGESALSDDADADGLNNLLEYGLGSNPSAASTAPAAQVVEITGQKYLQIQWTRPNDRADITTLGEISNDLAPLSWTSDPAEVLTTITPAGEGLEIVTIRDADPLGTNTKRFLRTRILMNAP